MTKDALEKEESAKSGRPTLSDSNAAWADIERRLMKGEDFEELWAAVKELRARTKSVDDYVKTEQTKGTHSMPVPDLPGVSFRRIPHVTKPGENVGNVLGKDFIKFMKDGTLKPNGEFVSPRRNGRLN